MNFWDRIKPAVVAPVATAVELKSEQQALQIVWDDGTTTQVRARTLRQQCPCAECVDEWTHERRIDPEKVPEDLKIVKMGPVGNYALSFVFGDAHQTGIFNWSYLRELSAP